MSGCMERKLRGVRSRGESGYKRTAGLWRGMSTAYLPILLPLSRVSNERGNYDL